jgi:hypothetical protein
MAECRDERIVKGSLHLSALRGPRRRNRQFDRQQPCPGCLTGKSEYRASVSAAPIRNFLPHYIRDRSDSQERKSPIPRCGPSGRPEHRDARNGRCERRHGQLHRDGNMRSPGSGARSLGTIRVRPRWPWRSTAAQLELGGGEILRPQGNPFRRVLEARGSLAPSTGLVR